MPFGKRQQALLDAYYEELRAAKADVNRWWLQLVTQVRAQHPDEDAAYQALKARWPLGPAVHPRFIAVVRKYHRAFAELNQELEAARREDPEQVVELGARPEAPDAAETGEDQPIDPGVILSEGVSTDATRDLEAIITKFDYWPIGMSDRDWLASSPS